MLLKVSTLSFLLFDSLYVGWISTTIFEGSGQLLIGMGCFWMWSAKIISNKFKRTERICN
jgi:hypothetical protein